MADVKGSIGKIKPLFTRAHPPASPRTSPVSPRGVPPSRTHPPAAGELGRPPGRPPAAHSARRAAGAGWAAQAGAGSQVQAWCTAHAEALQC
jgi:hypothetical protein